MIRKRLAALAAASALLFSTPALPQTASVQHLSSSALSNSLVIETNPKHTLSAFGCSSITGGTAGECIAYNAATVPGSGSLTGANVIDACNFNTAAGCVFSRIPQGVLYPAGIVILLSSAVTPFTYTTGTETGFLWADFN